MSELHIKLEYKDLEKLLLTEDKELKPYISQSILESFCKEYIYDRIAKLLLEVDIDQKIISIFKDAISPYNPVNHKEYVENINFYKNVIKEKVKDTVSTVMHETVMNKIQEQLPKIEEKIEKIIEEKINYLIAHHINIKFKDVKLTDLVDISKE